VALKRGAAPEVVIEGKTGFLGETEEELIAATKNISKIKPKDCRQYVEENFSRKRMVADYIKVYENIIKSRKIKKQV
jgi:glycosyltransferase involved in cell wall biosynthesis